MLDCARVLSAGFIGLGVMGQPMAMNLARTGLPLTVWNRTVARSAPLGSLGARVAESPAQVFDACAVVFTMLTDGQALDSVLERSRPEFATRVSGRIVVNMGTMAPDYAIRLAADIRAAGGDYVEACVSGSKGPAERGELVAMVAGSTSATDLVLQLLTPMCRSSFHCGQVRGGLLMKLAVNLYLLTTVSGLVEAFHFADAHHLDTHLLQSVLNAGPMASEVSRTKLGKLVDEDFAVQAALADVLKNNQLVADAARNANLASPMLDTSHALFSEAVSLGYGGDDMVAVVRALQARTRVLRRHHSCSNSPRPRTPG